MDNTRLSRSKSSNNKQKMSKPKKTDTQTDWRVAAPYGHTHDVIFRNLETNLYMSKKNDKKSHFCRLIFS